MEEFQLKKLGAILVVLGAAGLFVSVGFETTPAMETAREVLGDSLFTPGIISAICLMTGLLLLAIPGRKS